MNPLELEQRSIPMQTAHRQRILIIEDHECIAANLKIHLEAKGHEVRTVLTGEEGLEIADQFQPSLVLCDLSLPGIDGYTVARTLRHHPSLHRTRFIAMTGWSFGPDDSELRAAGFETGLSKPFNVQDLFRAIAGPPTPVANGALAPPQSVANSV
jgi:CheY-like chemotaxis protein